MRPPRHEVNCPRPVTGEDLGRKISRDISKTLRLMMASLVKGGVSKQDVIVLGQYSLSIAGIDLPSSTISAYRGMEALVVIVIAGFEMDDATLACALGRATTRAHIIVPIELLVGVRGVKSNFLRKLLDKMDRVPIIEQDALEAEPRFIENRVQRYAGLVGRHEVFGEGFAYASQWRRWVYEGGIRWSNRGVQLWGWMISLTTNTRIVGIDPVRNELTEGWLRPCPECEKMTPHDKFDRCLTCVSSPLDDDSISRIVMQAAV